MQNIIISKNAGYGLLTKWTSPWPTDSGEPFSHC